VTSNVSDRDHLAMTALRLTRRIVRAETRGSAPPAMTMEEIANEQNLREAFREAASNKDAPGPDRRNIDEVRKHLGELLLPRSSLRWRWDS
jgi:hypothetical protein